MTGNGSTGGFAVVTGASSGIGLELARQFAEHGYEVLAIAEDDGIHAAAASLDGGTVQPLQADLREYEEVERVWQAIAGRPVDALALNAGVGSGGPFVETPLEDDLGLIALNVTSTVHLAKRVIASMVQRGEGKVLVTASVAATMPGPYYATYAASKSFAQSFAEAVRTEVADRGVTVTALMPGPTDTNFFRRAGMTSTKAGQGPKDDPAEVAKDGFEALMAGEDHVVAGSMKNRVQTALAKVLPDKVTAAMHSRMTKPK